MSPYDEIYVAVCPFEGTLIAMNVYLGLAVVSSKSLEKLKLP